MHFHLFPIEGNLQTAVGMSGGNSSGPSLAAEALVCGPHLLVCHPALVHSSTGGCPDAGNATSSGPPVAQSVHLEVERCTLRGASLPEEVIRTIQASRRPSTDRIYSATWRAFCTWCEQIGVQALHASIVNILQEGLSKGLAPNTLRRQVAAISLILTCSSLTSLAQQPLIRCFL